MPQLDTNIAPVTSKIDPTFSLTHTLREAARHGERAVLLCSFQKEESVVLDESCDSTREPARRCAW